MARKGRSRVYGFSRLFGLSGLLGYKRNKRGMWDMDCQDYLSYQLSLVVLS